MKNMPNFLLISGGRSGTTSLYYYLSEHPEIYMSPNKEPYFLAGLDFYNFVNTPSFFIKDLWVKDFKSYKQLFNNVSNEKMIGEASVSYLYYYKETIPNIKKYLGDPKIIIIIRSPAERAYSHYLHNVQTNLESLKFEEAILKEKERILHNWWWGFHYKNAGFYLKPIIAYKNNFSNLKILFFDDFKDNFSNTFKEILLFLEVDVDFIPDNLRVYNSSEFYKFGIKKILYNSKVRFISRSVHFKMPKFLKGLLRKKLPKTPVLTLNDLRNEYKNEIKDIEILLNANLEKWYQTDNF
jgi:hypothetical protein